MRIDGDKYLGERVQLKYLVGYLLSLNERGFHGKVEISYYGGNITAIRPTESLDLTKFGWKKHTDYEPEESGGADQS